MYLSVCDQCEFTNTTEKGLSQHKRMKHRISQIDGVTPLHLDLLLQLVVGSGLLLAHLGLGHPSVLSGIVLWYKRPVISESNTASHR